MGGIIIIIAILVPVLLLGRLRNIYLILMIISTVWLGIIGFLDDYIKIFKKKKDGLPGRYKILQHDRQTCYLLHLLHFRA